VAFQHVPENYNTVDYRWAVFQQAGETYIELGELPSPPPMPSGYTGTLQRAAFAPLDGGQCLSLEADAQRVELARYAPASVGFTEVARWMVSGASSLSGASLHLLRSGLEALVIVDDRDDGHTDWGGGPLPVHSRTWLLINLKSGQTRELTLESRQMWPR